MQLNIRKAEHREYGDILEMVEASFMTYVAPGNSEQGQQSFLRYADYEYFCARQFSGHECFVACDETGRIVGMAELRQRKHISMFFVEPGLVGCGIGRALMEHCLARCRNFLASKTVTLNASDFALEFYKRMGFSASGPRKIEDGLISTPMQLLLTAKIR